MTSLQFISRTNQAIRSRIESTQSIVHTNSIRALLTKAWTESIKKDSEAEFSFSKNEISLSPLGVSTGSYPWILRTRIHFKPYRLALKCEFKFERSGAQQRTKRSMSESSLFILA